MITPPVTQVDLMNVDADLSLLQKFVKADKSAVVGAILHIVILLVAALGFKLPAKDVAILGSIVALGVSYFTGLNLRTKTKAVSSFVK